MCVYLNHPYGWVKGQNAERKNHFRNTWKHFPPCVCVCTGCVCSVPCVQTPPSSPWHGEPAAAESSPWNLHHCPCRPLPPSPLLPVLCHPLRLLFGPRCTQGHSERRENRHYWGWGTWDDRQTDATWDTLSHSTKTFSFQQQQQQKKSCRTSSFFEAIRFFTGQKKNRTGRQRGWPFIWTWTRQSELAWCSSHMQMWFYTTRGLPSRITSIISNNLLLRLNSNVPQINTKRFKIMSPWRPEMSRDCDESEFL